MSEHQTVEWKESWRDEYLRWLCGFANAEGGTLIIGKNDRGKPVGVSDAKRLLEEIPNKARDLLGIVPSVRLIHEDGVSLVEITVEPSPTAISYRGEYHVRSGSTKQELRGTALSAFLLRKMGRHWDSAPIPGVKRGGPGYASGSRLRQARVALGTHRPRRSREQRPGPARAFEAH
ncbi:MAG TPA: ATP-binding protein [Polyangiales bacterium]